nr:hypothetical protein Iba_chr02aCG11700 [Ipomoea batatas]
MWEEIPVEELKNQAAPTDAELERCGGVILFSFPAARVPLNVESDNEILQAMAVVVKGILDPSINMGSSFGQSDNKFDTRWDWWPWCWVVAVSSGWIVKVVHVPGSGVFAVIEGDDGGIRRWPTASFFASSWTPTPTNVKKGLPRKASRECGKKEIPCEGAEKNQAAPTDAELERCGGVILLLLPGGTGATQCRVRQRDLAGRWRWL